MLEGPAASTLLTLLVSFVEYVKACAWPSVIGLGTCVKVRTADCAAARAANALARTMWENIVVL